MKYIDSGIIYIPIDQDTTKEEMQELQKSSVANGQTVVFFRTGRQNMQRTISDLLNASLP